MKSSTINIDSLKSISFILAIICTVSLALKTAYFPLNVPIILDGLEYFWYANDISNTGSLVTKSIVGNSGWPIFLSPIFSIFKFNNFIDYMNLQRFVTVIISEFTIILVYCLCRVFFSRRYSLIGASIFAFESDLQV